MKFTNLDGLITHYTLDGHPSHPAVVFINSLGTDLRIWDDVVPLLAGDYFLLRYDKRGHGLSSTPQGPYSLSDFSADLEALISRLKIPDFILVGISVGGQIAMRYAIDHPGRVRALVLSDTLAKIGTAEYWQLRIENIRARGLPEMAAEIVPRWFAEAYIKNHPTNIAGYKAYLARMPQEGYLATCAALAEADLQPAAHRLTLPTLVLCGDADPATLPEAVRVFTESLPNAEFKTVSEAGHHPCLENPSETAEHLKAFLSEVNHDKT